MNVERENGLRRAVSSQQIVLARPAVLQRQEVRQTVVNINIIARTSDSGALMDRQLDDGLFGEKALADDAARQAANGAVSVQHPDAILNFELALGVTVDVAAVRRRVAAQAAVRDGRQNASRRALTITSASLARIAVVTRLAGFALEAFCLVLTVALSCGRIANACRRVRMSVALA